jgi:hypothetical protein
MKISRISFRKIVLLFLTSSIVLKFRASYFVARAGNLDERNAIRTSGIARLSGRSLVAYTHHTIKIQCKYTVRHIRNIYIMSISNQSDLCLDIVHCLGISKTKYFEDWVLGIQLCRNRWKELAFVTDTGHK